MGINQVAKIVKKLTSCLDDNKTYSNNSLRRTTKTRLVEHNIPNEISRRIVGHLSSSDVSYIGQNALEKKSLAAIKGSASSMYLIIILYLSYVSPL